MSLKKVLPLIVVAVASFLLTWSFLERPAPAWWSNAAEESQTRTVSVMFDFGDGGVKSFPDVSFSEGEHLFDVTKRLAEQNNLNFRYQPPGQFGILIDQIGDKVGGTDDKYWLWWENNRMGQVASDVYVLKSGDVLEWKFLNLKME